mmetsp:Transcript_35370/g.97914  ORF Transcript_35370/g.97914 Transcript_35370/m.97914 type:complete len:87 (+) Transcript_35370:179-439(+)
MTICPNESPLHAMGQRLAQSPTDTSSAFSNFGESPTLDRNNKAEFCFFNSSMFSSSISTFFSCASLTCRGVVQKFFSFPTRIWANK